MCVCMLLAHACFSMLTADHRSGLPPSRQVPIYSVSHRRGDTIHKFIATCGTTVKGCATKAYFADDEERANHNLCDYETARKAPCVLNDYTLAQPCLDRHNRYRQV